MYADAEKKSVLVTKWPLIVSCVNYTANAVVISGTQVLVDWISGDMDPEKWTLTYKLRSLSHFI